VKGWPLLAAVLLALFAGCGYVDDNPRAVRVVAQAYLDALRSHDAAAVCRVLAPEVQAAIAAGGTCDGSLPAHWDRTYPALRVGSAREVSGPSGNPRFEVTVEGRHGIVLTLGRYGSIWRVVGGGGLIR
jgi:hypothetical protein